MRTIMRSRVGRWTLALGIGLALGFARAITSSFD